MRERGKAVSMRYEYNNKYSIILKDKSIQVIYKPTNKELKTYVTKLGQEFVYIFASYGNCKPTPILKRDMLNSILSRKSSNNSKLTKANKLELLEYSKTLSYIEHRKMDLKSVKPKFSKGGRVEHTKFGLGTILTATSTDAIIRFDDGTERKIKLEYLK